MSRDMRAAYDNLDDPIRLIPGRTHRFQLESLSRIYGRGYGRSAEGIANVDSNNHFIAVVREPSCGPDAEFLHSAHWFWANTNASPDNADDLQDAIDAFLQVEFGFTPPNINQNIGSFYF